MDVLLIKVPEAAALLRISRAKLYELIASGALPAVKVDGCRKGTNRGPGDLRQRAVCQQHDVAAPEEFRFDVSVPVGGKIELIDGGGAVIVDSQDYPLGYLSPPWATDQAGAEVPTHYEVNGATLIQVVNHKSASFQYPIVADPYLWRDMVDSAQWDWIKRSPGGAIGAGWTLRVKPTKWARLHAGGYLPGYYGWRELYAKWRNRGLNRNLDSMKDQWICHQQFAAIRSPLAPTWNLDEWRADRSYAMTVRYQCNPPRGGAYAY